MKQEIVTVDGKSYQCYAIPLFKADLLVIRGENGFLGCGYVNLEACDKFGDAAAIVTGVADCTQMLTAAVKKVSSAAAARGITVGMTGAEALKLL